MDKNGVMFSILVPVYNVEEYIKDCVDSLISQTFSDYEIILVDDGSTDKSGLICDEYKNKYPNLIRVYHNDNQGLFLTRLFGIERALGKYFLFVDSDDFIKNTTLQRLYLTIVKYDCDIVMFDYTKSIDFNDNTLKMPFKKETFFSGNLNIIKKELLSSGSLNSIWSKCISKKIFSSEFDFKKYGGIQIGEDYIYSLIFIDKSNSVVYIPEILYFYRTTNKSLVHSGINRSNQIYYSKICEITKYYANKWNSNNYNYNRLVDYKYLYLAGTTLINILNYPTDDNKIQLMKILKDDNKLMSIINFYTIFNRYFIISCLLLLLKFEQYSMLIKIGKKL